MSGRGANRQCAKTRAAVERAFFELLFERGFTKLTVAAVIARANVGRSTFYEHYRTKQDLLNRSLDGPMATLASIIGQSSPEQALLPLLQHFRANQVLGRELFMPRTRGLVSRALAQQIERRLEALVAGAAQAAPLLPLGLIALHLGEAVLAVVEAWSLGRVAAPAERVAAALAASCNAAAAALLRLADEADERERVSH